MEVSSKFASLEDIDPELARNLVPGLNLQVSKRTFGQIAAAKFNAARGVVVPESAAEPIGADEALFMREAFLAIPFEFAVE